MGGGESERENIYIFKYFIYLFMRDREKEAETQGKQAPCREPDVGLNPGTPGSHPEPKANAQPLSHPGVPSVLASCQKLGVYTF